MEQNLTLQWCPTLRSWLDSAQLQRNKCSSALQGCLILGIAPLCIALYLDCTQLVSLISSSCVVWQKRGSVHFGVNRIIR